MKIIIEYDNDILQNISNELYTLFKNNNYDVLLLNNNVSLNNKINIISNNNNYLLISNKLSNGNMEIIYPLNNNDKLARDLYEKLNTIINVSKYYQLRSSSITYLDYYELFRYIKNNLAVIIKYSNNSLNNKNIPIIIYDVISNYLSKQNTYIVKSGDSLYSIAKKFNTTVDELKNINNLTNNLLSIGKVLIIPSNNQTVINNNNNIYIVKSGDSLYSIAKKFNTTVDDLKKVNNLTNNLLSINQKLIIPTNDSIITYTVTKGDSLYQIAKKFNTTVDKIKKDNNLTSNLLSIGQKLFIKK